MNKVAIFSVPRSGSSWLGQIFNSNSNVLYKFQPNFAYSFENTLKENSSAQEIDEFYQNLILTNDSFVNAKITISSKKSIQFVKQNFTTLVFKETHYINVIQNLIKNSDTKIIGLIRSPFAVINSWLGIPKEFDPKWDLKNEWKSGKSKNNGKVFNYFGYFKWKEAAKLFLQLQEQFPEKVKLVNYSNLISQKEGQIKDVFEFCDLEYEGQTKQFLKQSNKRDDKDAYSVFKKKENDNGWKNTLPEFIVNEIKADEEFQHLNSIFHWI